MAQSKFIQSVVKAAKGRPRSTQWFRDKIAEFGKPGAMDLIRDGKRDNAPFFGRLNMFHPIGLKSFDDCIMKIQID